MTCWPRWLLLAQSVAFVPKDQSLRLRFGPRTLTQLAIAVDELLKLQTALQPWDLARYVQLVALGHVVSIYATTAFAVREDGKMPTYLAFHEVDDVERWRNMPTRDEFFGPLGITHRTFKDPQGSNRVGLMLEIPDFGKFQEAMQSDQAAEAMKHDGVHPETLLVLEEA